MAKFVRNLTVQQGLVISGTEDVIGAGDLPASGATAGTYGDASHTLTVTVDVAGRITSIATNVISAGMTNPMTTLGDLIYEDATPAPARLAGNTSTTRKFLRQTGTGSASAAPAWDTLVVGDLPPYPGQILAFGQVQTSESTTSNTFVDLTTPDSVSITLASSANLLIEYVSSMFAGSAGVGGYSELFLDGVDQSLGVSANTAVANAFQAHLFSAKLSSVAAGTHTIDIKHHTTGGVTLSWAFRSVKVSILP